MKRLPRLLLLASALASVAVVGDVRADAPAGPAFKGFADLIDTVQIASGFSPDKQAATIIFRNMVAATARGADTRIQAIHVPIDKNEKGIKLTQDVRGYVSRTGKAKATLIVQAAGKTTVVDLDKARNGGKQKTRPTAEGSSKALQDSRKSADQAAGSLAKAAAAPDGGFDFMTRIEAYVPPGSSYQVTLILLVEAQGEAGDGAYLGVDSIDLELRPSAK